MVEYVDTLVVGTGQAGIAMSDNLGRNSISHLVLEKHRVAEAWRLRRSSTLVCGSGATPPVSQIR